MKSIKRKIPGQRTVSEDVNNVFKVKRPATEARAEAGKVAIEAGDPMHELVVRHKKAKKAAAKACRNELKSTGDENASKFDSLIISNSCIKDGRWIDAGNSGIMYIVCALHAPSKKGIFRRILSGSIGNWGKNVGVAALQAYVKEFLGKTFARQVTKKTVFDGVDEQRDRIKFYVAFKLLTADDKFDESELVEPELEN